MRKFIILLLSLSISSCFSQTKEQLIDTIIKVNRVDSNCIGIGCSESPQYNNFQKLKTQLSDKELIELSKHENSTIRTYASIEIIQSDKGNIPEILSYQLKKNDMVKTFEGCIMGIDPVSSIIYHEYWNKIRNEAIKSTYENNYEQDLVMKKRLASDLVMEKLDSIVIHFEKEVFWLLYSRAFENRKYKDSYLPRIEELAFNHNNAYAFMYLNKYYQSKYLKKIDNYFKVIFPMAEFQNENEIFYLHSLIEILLESDIEERKEIVIEKMKNNKDWEMHSSWFKRTLNKYGIEF